MVDSKDNKPTYLLLSGRIPQQEPGHFIGRFVTHPTRPLENYEPENPSRIIGDAIVQIEERLTSDILRRTKNLHAKIALQGVLDLTVDGQSSDSNKIRAKYIKTYRLENHYKAFDRLEADLDIRYNLEKPKGLFVRSHGKLYMITGYKTCSPETSFSVEHRTGGSFSAHITIPLSQLVAGLPINIVNPSVGGGSGSSHQVIHHGISTQEEVFAVEYKIVTKRGFWGQYSDKAATVIAHNVMTHDWHNAVYSRASAGKDPDGLFDDDDDDDFKDPGESSEKQDDRDATFLVDDRHFDIDADKAISEADVPGEILIEDDLDLDTKFGTENAEDSSRG